MSLFSLKQPGGAGVQPWSNVLTLFPGGGMVDGLFNLYNSLGDVALVGASTIATLLDGPEKVVRYGNLTVGDGVTATSLTASNRCKGLTILCDTLTVKANATVNMTGKGPRILTNDDPFYPFVDFKIPNQIGISSSLISYAAALNLIKMQGFAPWDRGTWQALVSQLYGFNLSVVHDGALALLAVTGCGAPLPSTGGDTNSYGVTGRAGTSGGTGSGGQGGWISSCPAPSGAGTPYGGGSGTGALCNTTPVVTQINQAYSFVVYSGPSPNSYTNNSTSCCGGAGIPGGSGSSGGQAGSTGVGGKLVIIARTLVSVQAGGKIAANGMPGGIGTSYNGGGSGGGHVSIITPVGGLSNSGTIEAAGGIGGGGANNTGGSGGAGSVVTKTFTDMGW